MGIESWSTTAASNNAAAPNGAPEGMAPASVNDTIRQCMASERAQWEGAEWFNWGDTCTYVSGTSFTISGDVTARYLNNRRIRAVGSSTGTIYGTVTNSTYVNPNTTVTVRWDSGSLSNESLTISLSIFSAGYSLPSTSSKTCAASYTRITPNYCRLTSKGSHTSLTMNATNTISAPHANATAVEVEVKCTVVAGGSTTLKSSQVIFSVDSGLTLVQGEVSSSSFEPSGTVAGTQLNSVVGVLGGRLASAGSSFYLRANGDTACTATYAIVGYYD